MVGLVKEGADVGNVSVNRPARAMLFLALGLSLVSMSCGTRVEGHDMSAPVRSDTEGAAASGVSTAPAPAASAADAGQGESDTQSASGSAAVSPAVPGVRPVGAANPGRSTDVAGTNGGSVPTQTGASVPTKGPGAGAPTPTVTTGPAIAPGSGTHSPVLLATVGTLSGPVGLVLAPVLQGVQLWVKDVNARGGVNGHQINLIVYDDGADPSRHRAQVQEAVEQRHVLAFVGNAEVMTGGVSVGYQEAKGIPVVGDSGGNPWALKSPMYFTQVDQAEAFSFGIIASSAAYNTPAGRTKLGTIVCAEAAQSCEDFDRDWRKFAKSVGFEVVYQARTSLATPDFTAHCLAARNAGVQVFLNGLDKLSVSRMATACARQGYRPHHSHVGWTGQADDQKRDPNLDDLDAPSGVFPYFQSGTPATDEFQRAVRSYGGGVTLGAGLATGWTAGKLFERAAVDLPEPPTTVAILKGLWSIKHDDLGGLTKPLTFEEGKAVGPATSACWWTLLIKNGQWTSAADGKRLCREVPKLG